MSLDVEAIFYGLMKGRGFLFFLIFFFSKVQEILQIAFFFLIFSRAYNLQNIITMLLTHAEALVLINNIKKKERDYCCIELMIIF